MFLQRGDTIPETCTKNKIVIKMNLRMLFEAKNTKVLDCLNGEFAKITSTNKTKFYDDKTKLVLVGKFYLNQLIMSLGGMPALNTQANKLPIVQVLSLNLHIYFLSIIDKDIYFSQKLEDLSDPRTLHEIKSTRY